MYGKTFGGSGAACWDVFSRPVLLTQLLSLLMLVCWPAAGAVVTSFMRQTAVQVLTPGCC